MVNYRVPYDITMSWQPQSIHSSFTGKIQKTVAGASDDDGGYDFSGSLDLQEQIEALHSQLQRSHATLSQVEREQLEGRLLMDMELTKTREELVRLRERYDRLMDSHKKMQRLNNNLEDKLLRLVSAGFFWDVIFCVCHILLSFYCACACVFWCFWDVYVSSLTCMCLGSLDCLLVKCQTCDRKVAFVNSDPSRSGRRIFFCSVNFVCQLLFSVHSTPHPTPTPHPPCTPVLLPKVQEAGYT